MNKSRIYIVIIVLLVICNGILGFFLFSKPGPPPEHPDHKKPKEVVAEKLNFSEEQVAAYEDAIKAHRDKISVYEEELRHLKDALFATVLQETEPAEAAELAAKIGDIQTNIELLHVAHFRDLKTICTPDQADEFEALVKELGKIFAPHNAHPPKKK
jgi:hypothetical protein